MQSSFYAFDIKVWGGFGREVNAFKLSIKYSWFLPSENESLNAWRLYVFGSVKFYYFVLNLKQLKYCK